jgi:MFS-type transporter involved in bile tolerance (Atg22 family)
VCGRFSAVLGPALFGWLSYVTGSKSWSILSLVLMFAAGAWLLRGVDEQRGRAELLAGESAR